MEKGHASHSFPAVYDKNSRILILGSFPSVASRAIGFFYGHKQNRFWKVLSACLNEECPMTIEEKREMCLRHGIALYDSIESCDIEGSSDASISNVEPADLGPYFETGKIKTVIFNGRASERWFHVYQKEREGVSYFLMPSTSAANAATSLDKLIAKWGEVIKP
ncbi:MAG: DNA-deoxyinosine glycosylase [Bacilli bacterium]|nr:DNA-deoxyinosine glycosylase [Bacilli bacterium]